MNGSDGNQQDNVATDSAQIVSIGAGDRGKLLLERWRAGGHTTADGLAAASGADVILIDANAVPDLTAVVPVLAKKIVIDCSRPASFKVMDATPSRAVQLAELCPTARVVKTLCTLDTDALTIVLRAKGPLVRSVYTSAYYCSNDAAAAAVVTGLLQEASLDPVDCGPLDNARLLDSLAVLESYLRQHTFDEPFSISVVRKPEDRSPLDAWM